MTIISLIAAIDEDCGLGKNNQLLCHLPADLKHFKELTLGKAIIMGRNTYDSIGKPLPQRQNIVLTRRPLAVEGIFVVESFSQALKIAENKEEVMVIGGAQIYHKIIHLADKIYLTKIHHRFDADVFFPILDENDWAISEENFRPTDEKNPYDLTFYTYTKSDN